MRFLASVLDLHYLCCQEYPHCLPSPTLDLANFYSVICISAQTSLPLTIIPHCHSPSPSRHRTLGWVVLREGASRASFLLPRLLEYCSVTAHWPAHIPTPDSKLGGSGQELCHCGGLGHSQKPEGSRPSIKTLKFKKMKEISTRLDGPAMWKFLS